MPDINTSAGLPPVQPGMEPGQTATIGSTQGTTATDSTPPPVNADASAPQQTNAPALPPPEPTTQQDLEQTTAMLYTTTPADAFNPDIVAQLTIEESQNEYENAQQERNTALSQQLTALSNEASDQRKAGNDAFAAAMVMGCMSIAAGSLSGLGTVGAGGDTEMELSQGKVQMARWNSFGDTSKGFGTVGQAIAQKYASDAQADQTADQKIATKAGDRHDAASQNMQKAESVRESVISVLQKISDAQTEAEGTAARNV